MKLVWLPAARQDRTAAVDYIAADNPSAALKQLDEIERQSERLAAFPLMGREGRVEGTRELVITGTPFILVYRVPPGGGQVQILRLLHGAQRWP